MQPLDLWRCTVWFFIPPFLIVWRVLKFFSFFFFSAVDVIPHLRAFHCARWVLNLVLALRCYNNAQRTHTHNHFQWLFSSFKRMSSSQSSWVISNPCSRQIRRRKAPSRTRTNEKAHTEFMYIRLEDEARSSQMVHALNLSLYILFTFMHVEPIHWKNNLSSASSVFVFPVFSRE